jgi:hypothetical protein
MAGKIHASSTDIYEDQAKALFDYYEKVASNIIQQEMSLEKAIKGAEEEILQIQQFLKASTTQGIIFLSVGGAVIAFGWLAHWVLSLLGLVPAAIGAYKLRTSKETAATRTAEKQSQIQGFQEAHRAIKRDFKVHRLGVVYVAVSSQIPFEGGSILVDHSGSVGKRHFTLATLRDPEALKGSVARIEESLNTVPLVERSTNVEQVDTADYSTSIQQVSLYGSCPKSVIDDKRFRGNKLWLDGLRGGSPKADDLAASGNPKVSGCLRFGPSRNSCGSESRAGASTGV